MKNREDKNKLKSNDSHAGEDQPKKSAESKSLPGEYPANEDIMNRRNEMERVPIDPDRINRSQAASTAGGDADGDRNESASFPPARNSKATSKSDLTKEDFEALGPRDLSLDGGDDEQLKHRVWPVDFGARDLDVPTGDENRTDALGQGDEENDHYSLGGDDKENLEDDPTRTFG